jgi:hypothetical protein
MDKTFSPYLTCFCDRNKKQIIRRVRESLTYIHQLDPATKAIVVRSYGEAVHVTLLSSVAVAICAAVACLCIKERPLARR